MMRMKVADLTVDELQALIRQTVEDVLAEWLDESQLLVRDELAQRIRASIASGDRGTPIEEAARRLGLDW